MKSNKITLIMCVFIFCEIYYYIRIIEFNSLANISNITSYINWLQHILAISASHYSLLLFNELMQQTEMMTISIKLHHHLSMKKNVYFSTCLITESIIYAMTFERLIAERFALEKTVYQHPDVSTLARELPTRRMAIRSERPRVN